MQVCLVGEFFHKFVGVTRALCKNDDAAALAARAELLEFSDDIVVGHLNFGNDNDFRAAADTRVKREVAAVSAHDFHDGNTFVRRHSVADLIDSVEDRIASGIEAERVVGIGKVVVDRAGNTDRGETEF